jgi:DNA-binding response OmpR family regulator
VICITAGGIAICSDARRKFCKALSSVDMNLEQEQKSGKDKRVADVDRKRVLVIDDDLPIRGMLAAALRQHGFQVLLAGDGAEGQRAMTIHRPDVILLDLAMPDVNGWDFLQRLQETGHLGKVPIIVVSAHVRVEPQALLQMGVAAILPKPFNLPDLLDLIEHLA